MSYDLFFRTRDGSSLDTQALADYFKQRPNYQVSEQQAIYENDATGVYFIFDIGDPGNEEDPGLAPLAFNLNYMRPHVFGLEAEPEVRALVDHFGLLVSDPQIDGMGEGEFSTEKFLSGWNAGNEMGCRAIFSRDPNHSAATMPTAQIEACWRWNMAKHALQETFDDSVFVPKLFFLRHGDGVRCAVVWPDGIPIAMPDSDLIVIQRKDVLPKRFLFSNEDVVIAERAEVERMLQEFPVEQGALPYRLLDYEVVPESVLACLRSLTATKEKPEAVATDHILNAELVEMARRRK